MHPLPAIQFLFAVQVNTPENQTKLNVSIPSQWIHLFAFSVCLTIGMVYSMLNNMMVLI
jgi:hypothetical protein